MPPNVSLKGEIAMTEPAPIFDEPHYAVIFSTRSRETDSELYGNMAEEMEALAAKQPGFLGIESARTPGGLGITVSYWRDMESIALWRDNARHRVAQQLGRDTFYDVFSLRIARVESSRRWQRDS